MRKTLEQRGLKRLSAELLLPNEDAAYVEEVVKKSREVTGFNPRMWEVYSGIFRLGIEQHKKVFLKK